MSTITEVDVNVSCPGRNFVTVRLHTSDGLIGVGDATLNGRELAVATLLRDHLADVLKGRDSSRIEDIWQLLYRASYWRGGPVQMSALAGVDMALWDLAAQRAGMPLYQLLGGKCREGALAYCHVSSADMGMLESTIDARLEDGWTVLRPFIAPPSSNTPRGLLSGELDWPGSGVREAAKMLHRVREHVGPDIELLFDVHGRLEPMDAVRLARDVEDVRLLFLEDPLRPEQHAFLARLRASTITPLAIGERVHEKVGFAAMLAERLVDFVRADIGHVGGITEARKLASAAEMFNVRTAWHGPPDLSPIGHCANVHLSLATWNFGVQEAEWMTGDVADVFPSSLSVSNGRAIVGDEPGIGCVFEPDVAERFPYEPRALPIYRSSDGQLQDW